MTTMAALVERLTEIDGRGYKAYKSLRGTWAYPDFVLHVDHVQGDPFATPTRVRALVPASTTELASEACATAARRLGVASLLARRFHEVALATMKPRGIGKSGVIKIAVPGQEVVDQTAVIVAENGSLEARFTVGLPASGRRILGSEAVALLTHDVPAVVDASLREGPIGADTVLRHALTNEDAEALRDSLAGRGWVAFVADGSSLPRLSGIDNRPLQGETVVPFAAPLGLSASVELPNAGTLTGMALPRGVSLVVGGGLSRQEHTTPRAGGRCLQPLPRGRSRIRGVRSRSGEDPSRRRTLGVWRGHHTFHRRTPPVSGKGPG